MPAPLQPVLPLPQDPSAQLVVLPTEPTAHPASHHLGMLKCIYILPKSNFSLSATLFCKKKMFNFSQHTVPFLGLFL